MIRINKILEKASGLVGMCLLLGVISAQAASLTVTTTADAGVGSLRQAIIDANINVEENTVTFNIPTTDPGYNAAENRFTINLLSPLQNIPLAAMTINNNQPQGVTVRGNNSFRIFTLVDSAVVTINNVTISNGFSNTLGGGIFMGNSATLTLNGSTVSNNTASGDGGGVYMANSGTLTLINSTLRNNTAINGGGIYIFDSGTLNVTTSTINANIAASGGSGGGVFNGTSGTVNAANSTFDGNSASNRGGGIHNTATATLTNNTVTSNTALAGGGVFNNFVATLDNNLVALNTAPDGNDLLGRASLGQAFNGNYNLIGNADGSEGLGPTTNQLGTTASPIDPRIGPLKDNGGATLTRAVHNRSPAIDKGNSPSLNTDQRGRARPYDNLRIPNAPGGDGADIGSFERTFSPTPFDYDGDGRADISVFRPSDRVWYLNQSTAGFYATQWGLSSDKITPADYDGDGKTDIAVWRGNPGDPDRSIFYIVQSSTNTFRFEQFGKDGDQPVIVSDWDGDGRADPAVYREGTGGGQSLFFYRPSSQPEVNFITVRWGVTGDKAVHGDFDGDGKLDAAVFRPSNNIWYIRQSSDGQIRYENWGLASDKFVPADYDGDGKTDIAVYRPSTGVWYIKNSASQTNSAFVFGLATDIPAPGDFDGDGKADISVFRPSDGIWYRQNSSNGSYFAFRFGLNGDIPTPTAFN